ncbi:MAG: TylF/MycF/NovP-related O-methyltransferase [Bryobacteraceae bacterium]
MLIKTETAPQTPEELYLDLLKKVLTRAVIASDVERHTIAALGPKSRLIHRFNRFAVRHNLEAVRLVKTTPEDYLESGHEAGHRMESAETMLGLRQLQHMENCIVDVLRSGIPGDLLEAGVWRGGMTIFMRGVLRAYGVSDRRVWVADSFEGLPEPEDGQEYVGWNEGDMAVPLERVRENFERYGLLDDQVRFLPGFFSNTLPQAPIEKLAILRVDADLHSSTLDVLNNLYARLSPGGYAIFDDYHNLPDCKRAIHEFRTAHGITEEIKSIDTRAVYWRREASNAAVLATTA